MSAKPPVSLSLDLDNLWSYLKSFGDQRWREYPSYLESVVPQILEQLDALDLTITFFLVGRDVDHPRHRELVAAIADAGHEIANHSYEHASSFHRADRATVNSELERTEQAIQSITGEIPVGFRGPSFRLSETILTSLMERNYRYDASTFPTYLGPLARAYLRTKSTLSEDEKQESDNLFGTFRDGRRPLNPYRWSSAERSILEIPVTTFPILRTPIHFSYINFVADRSTIAARAYLNSALSFCRVVGVCPSILLHATDFIGRDHPKCPHFLPGMKRETAAKLDLLNSSLERVSDRFDVQTMRRFAASGPSNAELPKLRVSHDL